jgi:DNA-directed RNA polymerase specialized sigma24 family protein
VPASPDLPAASSHFHTTHWSVVRAAGRPSGPEGREALERLCETYWLPLHAFIRRRGHDADEARDLTQGFFASFLARDDLAKLDSERGRFRSYLLGAVKHFLANEREREGALKRGGGLRPLSAESLSEVVEQTDERSPEAAFERQWAIALLGRALERLRAEQYEKGRGERFEGLRPTLDGGAIPGGRATLAAELGISAVALRVASHRLRARYRELVTEEVAHTLDRPQDVEDEIRHLFLALES